jgi:hypothetical protein
MFGRIVNRERPVVVLFAIHKVASERKSVRESDSKFDLFATLLRRWQLLAIPAANAKKL